MVLLVRGLPPVGSVRPCQKDEDKRKTLEIRGPALAEDPCYAPSCFVSSLLCFLKPIHSRVDPRCLATVKIAPGRHKLCLPVQSQEGLLQVGGVVEDLQNATCLPVIQFAHQGRCLSPREILIKGG